MRTCLMQGLKERDKTEDLDVDGNILLKWFLGQHICTFGRD
jgi:hypothetical protein